MSRLHGPLHQVPGLEKTCFQGPKLVCEFWCNGVMTYHFGNLLTSQTLILSQIFIFYLKYKIYWGFKMRAMRGLQKFWILNFFFFANICAQSFYSTSSMKGKGSVYSRASWTFELLYNQCGTWRF